MTNLALTKEAEDVLAQLPDNSRGDFASEAIMRVYKKEQALKKLDQIVKEAEASGFREINFDTWLDDMKAECRKRNAHRL